MSKTHASGPREVSRHWTARGGAAAVTARVPIAPSRAGRRAPPPRGAPVREVPRSLLPFPRHHLPWALSGSRARQASRAATPTRHRPSAPIGPARPGAPASVAGARSISRRGPAPAPPRPGSRPSHIASRRAIRCPAGEEEEPSARGPASPAAKPGDRRASLRSTRPLRARGVRGRPGHAWPPDPHPPGPARGMAPGKRFFNLRVVYDFL